MGIMLHKMKQIPIFKAGIGEGNTVAIFFSGIGSRSQRFIAVVVTVKDTPDFIAVFGAVFGLADQLAGMFDKMLSRLLRRFTLFGLYSCFIPAMFPHLR